MRLSRGPYPRGRTNALGHGIVQELVSRGGAADGSDGVGEVVVLDSEDPRGEDVLTSGGDALSGIDQLLRIGHARQISA
jgi:hypothetical protein